MLVASGLSRNFHSTSSRFSLIVEKFTLTAGDCLAVIGPSGCGKSTLLGLLSLALRPDSGDRLCVTGVDALQLWHDSRLDRLASLRAHAIGFVPQTAALLPFLSLAANIALPQRIRGRPDPAMVADLADWLGIRALLHRPPGKVSVGQRQRAAVARALSTRPPIVLADEPTASVHPGQAMEILSRLKKFAAETQAGIVVTTHDRTRAQSAGFQIVECDMDDAAGLTRLRWPA
ncbi:MAG TPA: ATP-binding cassette domain-containing protein [Rhodopila sp.]|nr:ATP-binding cassette domain-containing protein [Rhodopila sp.]